MLGMPPQLEAKDVAGFTKTILSSNSGASLATLSAKHPPKDSATKVTCTDMHIDNTSGLPPDL